jgi:heterokaryon incompatibility protein (HET)
MPPYHYSPLKKLYGFDSMRLLRLLPNEDKNVVIECRLFDYVLPHSDTENHIYEALSYVWGGSNKDFSISLNGCNFGVTANLHAALARLRNRYLERVVWIDAICINQEDIKEREHQIRYMARIFGKARCVIVWLGEADEGSDQVIELIRLAANKTLTQAVMTAEVQDNTLKLIERPWFRRIWVRVLVWDAERQSNLIH